MGIVSGLDWLMLAFTIGLIVLYGVWKSRGAHDVEAYFRDRSLKWPTIGLSIMATQASAITFLSTPGQAYDDGMRFVQFYFGLPLAMVVIAAVFVPIYHQLNVYTAYEYLEHRFDVRVRYLGALLFLIQRGLAAGITIYAPSIILSSILGWPVNATNLAIGLIVVGYTVSGGSLAVSQTQKYQMIVMLSGIALAAVLIFVRLPESVSLTGAVKLAGALGKINAVSFALDFENRYNFWSGIGGGFFLALAYFGTDQSQVQRYLAGRSITESRLGLLFNGMLKIPMQVAILFVGVLVFVFYIFVQPPLLFNAPLLEKAQQTAYAPQLAALGKRYDAAFEEQRSNAHAYVATLSEGGDTTQAKAQLLAAASEVKALRREVQTVVARAVAGSEVRDTDYVFLAFVLRYVPTGLVGLIIAVILCAAMSSSSSELSALGSITMIDLYKRMRQQPAPARHDLWVAKIMVMLWGAVAIGFASFAASVGNLIQAVNILGSIFYGTILGLFMVAFFLRRVTATPVLIAAIVAQGTVITLFLVSDLGFLWYNVIGCVIVVLLSAGCEFGRRILVRKSPLNDRSIG